jgi:hypothetical protein
MPVTQWQRQQQQQQQPPLAVASRTCWSGSLRRATRANFNSMPCFGSAPSSLRLARPAANGRVTLVAVAATVWEKEEDGGDGDKRDEEEGGTVPWTATQGVATAAAAAAAAAALRVIQEPPPCREPSLHNHGLLSLS